MSEEKHHHHLFHHRKAEEEEGASGEVDYEKKEKHHKHMEQLGQLGAIAAGAYALVRPKKPNLHPFGRLIDACHGPALDLCVSVRVHRRVAAAREAQGQEGPGERARPPGQGGGGRRRRRGLRRVRLPRASREEGRQEARPQLIRRRLPQPKQQHIVAVAVSSVLPASSSSTVCRAGLDLRL
jgi:hypothetical protein